jgi:hypothetical protein
MAKSEDRLHFAGLLLNHWVWHTIPRGPQTSKQLKRRLETNLGRRDNLARLFTIFVQLIMETNYSVETIWRQATLWRHYGDKLQPGDSLETQQEIDHLLG